MEKSLQAAIRSHIKACVVKLHRCQIFRKAVDSSAVKDQICIDKDKMAACWIKFPIAMGVIAHEYDRVYSRVCGQIGKYASAVNMIDPDNKQVGQVTVIDVIDETIGDSLYQFMEYFMTKCEKVISL